MGRKRILCLLFVGLCVQGFATATQEPRMALMQGKGIHPAEAYRPPAGTSGEAASLEKRQAAPALPVPRDYETGLPEPPPEDDREFTSLTLGAIFILIPAGTFVTGSPEGEAGRFDNETPHPVTVSRPFYLQTTEVTQGQWKRVMGKAPSHFGSCGDDCPVEQVSWYDVQQFIRKLNRMEGTDRYRLPTEAQWEYAARAGTTASFHAGDSDEDLSRVGWWIGNSGFKTHPVGRKASNAWGLYDMHGNVWEWVQDWYGSYPAGPVTDPEGPPAGSYRVIRGGSWSSSAGLCRSAFRISGDPVGRISALGFRLVRTK